MPEGFCRAEEAQMDKAWRLLSPLQDRNSLRDWWLAVPGGNAQTPIWDIASTCTVDGRKGFLLVEAKAHTPNSRRGPQTLSESPGAKGSELRAVRLDRPQLGPVA